MLLKMSGPMVGKRVNGETSASMLVGPASFRAKHCTERVVCTGAVSTANGSALVRLGDTTIVCGVKAEVAEPDWKTPNHGWIGQSPPSLRCDIKLKKS